MEGSGMVAVVRGLRDAGLAVTLLDNGKQYTLVPDSEIRRSEANGVGVQRSTATNCTDSEICCDSAAQATDGRYASVYKTTHCKVKPSSPPVLLTEFPPQRASVCRGSDNFVVGGTGSGDTTYSPIRAKGSYRGGMCWTDRASVFSPRPSRQPDAFAESLRKYPPALTSDRSSEVVERLINYTQAKNFKNQRYQCASPTRSNVENVDNYELNPRMSSRSRTFDPEINIRQRIDESPTRGPKRDYNVNYDVQYMRDMSKKVRDNIKSMGSCPYYQPHNNNLRERCEMPLREQRRHGVDIPYTVNTEIQASAKMVCREVATAPRIESSKRNVAVPISPASSDTIENSEGQVSTLQAIKSVQTNYLPDHPKKIRKSVQTTLSSIELVKKYRCRSLRRSKSEDDIGINNEDFRVEILRWLDDVFCGQEPKVSKNDVFDKLDAKLKKLSKICDRSKTKIGKIQSKTDSSKDCVKVSFKSNSGDVENMSIFPNRFSTEVYRAEVIPFKEAEAKVRKDAIKYWMNKIPFKSHDFLERPVERERILNSIFNKLKDISATTPAFLKNKLKGEIIDMLNEMPIDIKGSNNKRSYLDTIASLLLDDLCSNNRNYNSTCKNVYSNIPNRVQFKSDVHPTEAELKALINDELEDFFRKSHIKISGQRIEHIESNLLDIIIDGMSAVRSEHDKNIGGEIAAVLKQSAGLSEHQAIYITNLLLDHLREMSNYTEQSQISPIPCRLETVMMLQNQTMSSLNDTSMAGITEEDIETNLNRYIEQLSQQIDEWLNGLRILKPHEQSFRQVVVSDLAGDIVDRLKYLELNPSSRSSEEEELEHLKFQIFKWINKLVGENHTETIEHAPDLMRRIRCIPVPMLTRPGAGSNMSYRPGNVSQMPFFGPQGPGGSMTENRQKNAFEGRFSGPGKYASGLMYDSINMSQMPMFGPAGPGGMIEQQQLASERNTSSPGALGTLTSPSLRTKLVHPPKTMQELNNEFDDFVKKWVHEIPIAVNSPVEQELLPTMRVGLYNGVWRAITKLKCQPDVLINPFYFEDKLDDEIEELFALIPETPELESNKHRLKMKLIEKTSHINDLIKNVAQSESFKQRLLDNLEVYIPRLETDEANEDPIKLLEELEILYLVEEYILFTRFKDDDPVKASVYRNKLLKRVQELVQEIKRSHSKEMKDINPETYANDIVTALHQVPLPNNETIKQEADQILLGLEIEKWYADLPIARNNDLGEQLKRRRLRDALGRKIYEMERSMDFSDSNAERVLKHEVSRFLERVPLGRDETLNINFMVDELTNRIKNRQRPPGVGKKVAFDETIDYQNFSNNIPCRIACSSRIEEAVAEVASNLSAQLNQSLIAGSMLDGSMPQVHFSSQGGQSFTPNVSIIQGPGPYPQNMVIQNPGGYSSFDQQRPTSSSLNATDGGMQFQPGPYNSVIQSPGGYSVYDQERPASSSINATNAEAQYMPLHGNGQPQVGVMSPGQASMRSFEPGPRPDQSGLEWSSLLQSGIGTQSLSIQNMSSVGQSVPQAPVQQSFRQPHNYSSVNARRQNLLVQNPMGYMSFDEERPISSSFNQQASGGVEYFSMEGSSGPPIRGAGQVSMVQPGQDVSVHAPQASMQSSPVSNMSEQQKQSFHHSTNLPASQSMARQNMYVQAQPIGQASPIQQSFRNGTIPNSSFFPYQNSIVQSPMGFPTFEQERPISSTYNKPDPGTLWYTMPSFQQVSMPVMNSQSNLTNETPLMQSQVMSPRQETIQGNLSGRSVLGTSFGQGVTPQERSMERSIPAPAVGTQSGMTSPAQGLSTSIPPRFVEEYFEPQGPSGTLSAFGPPPVGFSTPQQGVPPIPPGLRRKQTREGQIPQRDTVRKRLDLQDEEDIDEERRGPCRCMEKLKRYRKRMRYPCPGYNIEFRDPPRRCYYPHYF